MKTQKAKVMQKVVMCKRLLAASKLMEETNLNSEELQHIQKYLQPLEQLCLLNRVKRSHTSERMRKSASKWELNSELALIEIWKKKLDDLRGCRKNSHILMQMLAELEAHGYTYTIFELRTKMHNMTARYRREKRKMRTPGGGPSDWDLFNEMEDLLSPYTSYNCQDLEVDSSDIKTTNVSQPLSPNSLTEASSASTEAPSSLPSPNTVVPSPLPILTIQIPSPVHSPSIRKYSGSSSGSSPPSPAARTDSDAFFKNMERRMDRLHKDIKLTSQRILAIEEEKKEILKSYVNREAKVQEALIDFLKRP